MNVDKVVSMTTYPQLVGDTRLPNTDLTNCWPPTHRMPKGPKMVFGGGRRQILSFLSQTNSIRPHLHHFQGIHLDKLHVQSKFKSTFTFFLIFCIFALFEPRFQYSMSIQPPFLTCQHICPSGIISRGERSFKIKD